MIDEKIENQFSSEIVCTVKEETVCADCKLQEQLLCRYDECVRNRFLSLHIPLRLMIFASLIYTGWMTGQWWFLIAYAVGFVLNFGLLETRYLCRHCPFYAAQGKLLRCPTLYGMPKWWAYDPGPLTRVDKVLQAVFGGFVDMFPLIGIGYSVWYLLSRPVQPLVTAVYLASAAAVLVLFVIMGRMLMKGFCTVCVNFSCPMNKVEPDVRDAYLRRNPCMQEAWREQESK